MDLKRFALGIKFDLLSRGSETMAVRMFEELFSILTLSDLEGLEIYGGMMPPSPNETEVGNIYLAVIMGGGLKQTRRIYGKIANDAAISMYLTRRQPFIQNNRLLNIEGLDYLGEVQKDGKLRGGNDMLASLTVPKKRGKRRPAGKGIKILLAPDSFNDTFTSLEVTKRLTMAARKHFQGIEIIPLPLNDGGKNTMRSMVTACDGAVRHAKLRLVSGERSSLSYGVLRGKTAVIELAGIAAATSENEPLPSQYAGELTRRALDEGLKRILIGTGNIIVNDYGIGFARALGAKFFDENGNGLLGENGDAQKIRSVDLTFLHPHIGEATFTLMQPVMPPSLPELPFNLVAALSEASGKDIASLTGINLGGGIGAMLHAIAKTNCENATPAMLDALDFNRLLKNVALVVTSCPLLNNASLKEDMPLSTILDKCYTRGIPVAIIAGDTSDGAEMVNKLGNVGVTTLLRSHAHSASLIENSEQLFDETAERMFLFIRMGRDVEKIGAPKKPRSIPYYKLHIDSIRKAAEELADVNENKNQL